MQVVLLLLFLLAAFHPALAGNIRVASVTTVAPDSNNKDTNAATDDKDVAADLNKQDDLTNTKDNNADDNDTVDDKDGNDGGNEDASDGDNNGKNGGGTAVQDNGGNNDARQDDEDDNNDGNDTVSDTKNEKDADDNDSNMYNEPDNDADSNTDNGKPQGNSPDDKDDDNDSQNTNSDSNEDKGNAGKATGASTTEDADNQSTTPECTQPAYLNFPTDLFRVVNNPGLVWIHILVTLYLFLAIALICDDYFCPSLDITAQKMGLSEDVAGATLMSFGSSAPELFISIIAVFVGSTDVGTGTIVGSAVFNILFVIGICGILVSQMCTLSWWPFIRDSVCYILTVLVLLLLMIDNTVTWWESGIMLLLYCLYIVLMKYNDVAHAYFVSKFAVCIQKDDETLDGAKVDGYASFQQDSANLKTLNNGYDPVTSANDAPAGSYPFAHSNVNGLAVYSSTSAHLANSAAVLMVDEEICYGRYALKLSFEDACWRFMITWQFRPVSRFRAAVFIIMFERRKLMQYPEFSTKYRQISHQTPHGTSSYTMKKTLIDPTDTQAWRIAPPRGFNRPYVTWLLCFPIRFVMCYTIIDCRKQKYERYYVATFLLSVLWISVISYILVWVVTSIGYVFGIPDAMMGITLLAAGTSISDCVSSVIVARKGYGDMAVSNSFGSNVFDILIGLGLPWFIQTAFVDPGSTVSINSRGLVYDSLLLFAAIFGTLLMIYMCSWKLNKKMGYASMGLYAFFLVFSLMIEFNLLGFVNPPMCDS